MELFGSEATGEPQGTPMIEGVVARVVFENPETGFYVARLQEPNKAEVTTIVGKVLAVSPGESVRIWGEWITDPKWGPQFKIARYEILQPSSVEGIRGFLGSGLIKGIGKKFADRIVDAFGTETLRIIEDEPHRLRDVEGIGRKLAAKIQEGIASQKAVQSIMVYLQAYGVGIHQAIRIYKRYGDRAVAVLRDNPYRLAWEVPGFGFTTADAIAKESGIAQDAPERAAAGLVHVLRTASTEGHTYLTLADAVARAAELLEVDTAIVEGAIDAATDTEQVIAVDGNVSLKLLHDAEVRTAHRIATLAASDKTPLKVDVPRAIAWVEGQQKIELSHEQRDAIDQCVHAPIAIITGGPGTGKTTLIRSLIAILEYKKLSVTLAAPTGKAARRMEEATGSPAQTIHRLLEFNPQRGRFARDTMNPLEADVVIVDEMSMVDIALMADLLDAIADTARVIFVGDIDQLPSVGPGAVLTDLIACNQITTINLTTIFRQAQDSGIVQNAHRINTGQDPQYNTKDVFFVSRPEASEAAETIIELVTHRIPSKFGLDPMRDIQVLTPMHRGDAGVAHLNERLQASLNPDGRELPRRGLRVGDKVMQLRNNYDLDVYNGDTGVLSHSDDELQEAQVDFEGRSVLYSYDKLDDLAPAYAMTIHKAQGSEYPAIVIALLNQHYIMLQRNMLYTAITRASKMVTIVGDDRAVRRAVQNAQFIKRNTTLAETIRTAMSPKDKA